MTQQQEDTWQFFKSLIRQHLGQKSEIKPPAKIDEDYLLRLMDEHRLELALYPFWKKGLTERCQNLLKQNLRQKKALSQIVQAFEKEKISYVVLKGLPLNQQLYGDRVVRRSSDIDILVNAQDFEKAHFCLNAIGFSHKKDELLYFDLFQRLAPQYQRWIKDLLYIDVTGKIKIELHVKTTSTEKPITFKERRLSTSSLFSREIKVLSSEENFLYLCEHAAKHHWQRLQWLIDIATFYQKVPLDWGRIDCLVQIRNGRRAVLEAKYLLKKEWNIHIPALFIPWRDKFCFCLRQYFIKKNWFDCPKKRTYIWWIKDKMQKVLLLFLAYPTWQEKSHYFRSRFFIEFLKLRKLCGLKA